MGCKPRSLSGEKNHLSPNAVWISEKTIHACFSVFVCEHGRREGPRILGAAAGGAAGGRREVGGGREAGGDAGGGGEGPRAVAGVREGRGQGAHRGGSMPVG